MTSYAPYVPYSMRGMLPRLDQLSLMIEGISSLSVRIFGVVSGVFFLCNLAGVVSKCKELVFGPVAEIKKNNVNDFSRLRLQVDLGKDAGLALANALRVAAVVQSVFGVVSRANVRLNGVANCFSVFAAGCELVSSIQSIEHANYLLKNKTSLFKKEFLLEHRQSSVFSVALAIGNIAMSVLFCSSLILSSPVVMGISGVIFLLMLPLHYVALKQKFQIISSHGKESGCCEVFN